MVLLDDRFMHERKKRERFFLLLNRDKMDPFHSHYWIACQYVNIDGTILFHAKCIFSFVNLKHLCIFKSNSV